MKNLLIAGVLGFAVFSGYQHLFASAPMYGDSHGEVIMYSLTTCGYCKQKVKELDAQGIAYTELFLDKDAGVKQELSHKLAAAGFSARGYGTPIFDVHGYMLPNNPPLSEIQDYMDKG